MNTWFTSDTHFGHENIIKYTKRPFKNIAEMNAVLIRNWNSRVKPDDTMIFLGDFCFKNTAGGRDGQGLKHNAAWYDSHLNGNKVFIRGNHDNNNSLNSKIKNLVIEIGGHEIFCTHNPKDINLDYGINLTGHVHEKWEMKRTGNTVYVNVGVDVWKFMPVSIAEIISRINAKYKLHPGGVVPHE